ncbi:hypothetical protein [Bacillus glycinifermentans]|uniref:hypothetical protein n=1 Tax=Bacillus glycinifermentans TaxID=1664069 RepID=UPI002DB59FA7|nr:hypothetical protein [Bacillus glycinifermentans]MEC0494858.1 hypothetical protein [Bacillus glycinifermentans]MEC0540998.1 hypothetical protein [Bacillus glycinifermentans]
MYKAEKAITTVAKAWLPIKLRKRGLYGLAAANGFSETITGRDMFGNKISDERRQDSFNRVLSMIGAFCLRGVNGKLNAKATKQLIKCPKIKVEKSLRPINGQNIPEKVSEVKSEKTPRIKAE